MRLNADRKMYIKVFLCLEYEKKLFNKNFHKEQLYLKKDLLLFLNFIL